MWGHAWWQSQEGLCSEAQERYLVWGGGGGETQGERLPGEAASPVVADMLPLLWECSHYAGVLPAYSPVLGLQLLVPALMAQVLEGVPTLGQDRLLLGLGLLFCQLSLGLAPCLKFPERFLGKGEHGGSSVCRCMRAHWSFL